MNKSPTLLQRQPEIAFCWLLTFIWAAAIYVFSTESFGSSLTAFLLEHVLSWLHITVSPRTYLTLHFLLRKLAHVTEYGIFSLLLYGSFASASRVEWHARTALWTVFVASLYSLTDEFHQSFVPGRGASLLDCGIDTAGAALGMLGLYGRERLFPTKSSSAARRESPVEMKNGAAGL